MVNCEDCFLGLLFLVGMYELFEIYLCFESRVLMSWCYLKV